MEDIHPRGPQVPEKNFEIFKGLKLERGVRGTGNVETALKNLNEITGLGLSMEEFEEVTTMIATDFIRFVEITYSREPGIGINEQQLGVALAKMRDATRIRIMGVGSCFSNVRVSASDAETKEYRGAEESLLFTVEKLLMLLTKVDPEDDQITFDPEDVDVLKKKLQRYIDKVRTASRD